MSIHVKKVNDTIFTKSVLPATNIRVDIDTKHLARVNELLSHMKRPRHYFSEAELTTPEVPEVKSPAPPEVLHTPVSKTPLPVDNSPIELGIKSYSTNEEVERAAAQRKELPPVIGCPNNQMEYQISSVNQYRLKKGMTPFLTYAQYVEYDKNGTEPQPLDVNNESLIPGMKFVQYVNEKVSKSQVYCVAGQGYYLMQDGNQVYFLQNSDVSITPVILKSTKEGCANPSAKLMPSKFVVSRDLTTGEMMDLINNKVPPQLFLTRYAQYQNTEGVLMNLSNPKTIW